MVSVKSRALIKMSLGKFLFEMPTFIMEKEEDRLLGHYFLSRIGLPKFFKAVFGGQEQYPFQIICSRMKTVPK